MGFKKREKIGYFAIVDFTEFARQYCVGGSINKKIYIIYNNNMTNISYPYTIQKVKELELKGIPVIDLTIGLERPKESFFIPPSKLISGRLEIRRVV
ncbi:MAG: hypothetical protein ACE5J4_02290 [Candidatus Aenigmatarchaeota archaeon]